VRRCAGRVIGGLALLISPAGPLAAASAGVPLGFPEISWFLFAVGLGFWLTFLPLLPIAALASPALFPTKVWSASSPSFSLIA
jgi:hypothetical protein